LGQRFGGSATRNHVRCNRLSKRSILISILQKPRIGTGHASFQRGTPAPRSATTHDNVAFRVYKTGSPPGIRPQQDPRVIRRGNDNKHNDSEIAEDVSSSPSASDDDECSVLTDITNPTDLRSETQQSLALESTLGEVCIRTHPSTLLFQRLTIG